MKRFVTAASAAAILAIGGSAALSAEDAKTPLPAAGKEFKDCAECPAMVVLPAGSFIMGANPGEEERENMQEGSRLRSLPQYKVTLARPIAVGKFEVTREEYARFVAETKRPDPDKCITTGRIGNPVTPAAAPLTNRTNVGAPRGETKANWRNPGYKQTDRDPVVCVNWNDAQAYVQWLAKKTGKPYRLLSEAEWEYAARAGTTTSRWWGESPDKICDWANVTDLAAKAVYPTLTAANCRDGYANTAPVDKFKANAFGVHILGNVWEWVEDCWNQDYSKGAPTDGSARATGQCDQRVLRGGSWFNEPSLLRSAVRRRSHFEQRHDYNGFRVARTN